MSRLIKIAIVGPESTGKTTLAKNLAEYYNTVWIPEFARGYLQNKWDTEKEVCSEEDQIIIAKGQIELEKKISKQANNLLICDTCILSTLVYSKLYFEKDDKSVEEMLKGCEYDFFILTDIDIPWVEDSLRDMPHRREEIRNLFEEYLIKFGYKYFLVNGKDDNRLQKSIKIIDGFISKNLNV